MSYAQSYLKVSRKMYRVPTYFINLSILEEKTVTLNPFHITHIVRYGLTLDRLCNRAGG